jgi:hypothetical protein
MHHEGAGCFALGILSAAAPGLIGFGLATVIAPIVNVPNFTSQFTFLAALDGLGIASVWYWRSTRRAQEYGPVAICLQFLLIGMFAARGTGFESVVAWGLGNATLGFAVAWLLTRRGRERNDTSFPEDSN